jgi:hypothetical protein
MRPPYIQLEWLYVKDVMPSLGDVLSQELEQIIMIQLEVIKHGTRYQKLNNPSL